MCYDNGFAIDCYGYCKTCQCIPDYEKCHNEICDIYCPYGYVEDENGCPNCQCEKKICPAIQCSTNSTCEMVLFF